MADECGAGENNVFGARSMPVEEQILTGDNKGELWRTVATGGGKKRVPPLWSR